MTHEQYERLKAEVREHNAEGVIELLKFLDPADVAELFIGAGVAALRATVGHKKTAEYLFLVANEFEALERPESSQGGTGEC